MYDETITVTDDGVRLPYSGTLGGDRKFVFRGFITRAYVAPISGYIALKFENKGSGEVTIQYNAGGHRFKLE